MRVTERILKDGTRSRKRRHSEAMTKLWQRMTGAGRGQWEQPASCRGPKQGVVDDDDGDHHISVLFHFMRDASARVVAFVRRLVGSYVLGNTKLKAYLCSTDARNATWMFKPNTQNRRGDVVACAPDLVFLRSARQQVRAE